MGIQVLNSILGDCNQELIEKYSTQMTDIEQYLEEMAHCFQAVMLNSSDCRSESTDEYLEGAAMAELLSMVFTVLLK